MVNRMQQRLLSAVVLRWMKSKLWDYMVTHDAGAHILSESRIHYVITRGGEVRMLFRNLPEVFYYCRHPIWLLSKKF